jgi:hypothetical protein
VIRRSLLGAWADRLGNYRHGGQVRLAAERDRLVRLARPGRSPLHRLDLAAAAPRRAPGDAARLHPDAARRLDRHGRLEPGLMLALPPLALLRGFALPTLQRSRRRAAIDWFSSSSSPSPRDRLGLLRGDADRRAGKLAANVAKLSPASRRPSRRSPSPCALGRTVAWAWL